MLAKKLPRFLEHNPGLMASVVITPTNVAHAADGLAFLLDTGFRYLIIKPDVTQAWSRATSTSSSASTRASPTTTSRARARGDEIYLNLFDDKWINHAKGAEGDHDPLRRRHARRSRSRRRATSIRACAG